MTEQYWSRTISSGKIFFSFPLMLISQPRCRVVLMHFLLKKQKTHSRNNEKRMAMWRQLIYSRPHSRFRLALERGRFYSSTEFQAFLHRKSCHRNRWGRDYKAHYYWGLYHGRHNPWRLQWNGRGLDTDRPRILLF
jgi:hypothetical protein